MYFHLEDLVVDVLSLGEDFVDDALKLEEDLVVDIFILGKNVVVVDIFRIGEDLVVVDVFIIGEDLVGVYILGKDFVVVDTAWEQQCKNIGTPLGKYFSTWRKLRDRELQYQIAAKEQAEANIPIIERPKGVQKATAAEKEEFSALFESDSDDSDDDTTRFLPKAERPGKAKGDNSDENYSDFDSDELDQLAKSASEDEEDESDNDEDQDYDEDEEDQDDDEDDEDDDDDIDENSDHQEEDSEDEDMSDDVDDKEDIVQDFTISDSD
ncbi:NOC2 [Mytilus coruscus]|uniref:NOC2 n=1 Tax=Mytilus coruscus TaxID=42192 RepID=A0A6J8F2M0_MYTCO|nr:NOC2 [Mytilus coruscus]